VPSFLLRRREFDPLENSSSFMSSGVPIPHPPGHMGREVEVDLFKFVTAKALTAVNIDKMIRQDCFIVITMLQGWEWWLCCLV